MTREAFIARAILTAERDIGVPPGWWGVYLDVTNGSARVVFSPHGRCWRLTVDGVEISRHDSRPSAIKKAAKL